MLTKAEEIALLDKTIAGLPEGYLKDILTSERNTIVRAIECDLTCLDMHYAFEQMIGANRELQQVRDRIREVGDELTRRNRAINSARSDILKLVGDLQKAL